MISGRHAATALGLRSMKGIEEGEGRGGGLPELGLEPDEDGLERRADRKLGELGGERRHGDVGGFAHVLGLVVAREVMATSRRSMSMGSRRRRRR